MVVAFIDFIFLNVDEEGVEFHDLVEEFEDLFREVVGVGFLGFGVEEEELEEVFYVIVLDDYIQQFLYVAKIYYLHIDDYFMDHVSDILDGVYYLLEIIGALLLEKIMGFV
jgi:hypothetical protein